MGKAQGHAAPPSKRAIADAAMTERIRTFHARSKGTYGSPRIHQDLFEEGVRISRKRIARLMRQAGLQGVSRRKGCRATIRSGDGCPAPDLVERRFTATAPDQLWVADITCIPTWAGFLSLAEGESATIVKERFMDRPFFTENTRERERLRALVGRLSDEELRLDLGGGWTVAAALAHLAFWDQLSLVRIRQWRQHGVSPSSLDLDVINDALLPLLLLVPPRRAAELAMAAAEAIDRELGQLSPELIAAIGTLGDKRRLFRSIHRGMHLDQIEEALTGLGHSM